MRQFLASGSPFAAVRPELEPLVDGVAFEPRRADAVDAQAVLDRDGAVILNGYPPAPRSLVLAAAEVLGTRLRHVQPARTKDTEHSDGLPVHNENRIQVIEVGGQVTDLYGPDADYILLLCARPSETGGASVVADGYRLFDRIRDTDPELWSFLTGADVDRLGLARDQPDIPTTSSACRHLEYTRTGRRIVLASWYTQALRRDPLRDQHERMLQRYADVWTTLTAAAPRFFLGVGDILFVDNYRCFHGVDVWGTRRVIHSLTVRSADAK
ncbi:MAG: TauD/TfdA family dioxygenase [Pseudonocardiaceae bacterium]